MLKNFDESAFEEMLAQPFVVLFKHSPRCGVSLLVQTRVIDKAIAKNPELDIHLIDVLAQRSTSNRIAEQFDIHHESPQLIALRDGQVVYHKSHWGINIADIEQLLAEQNQALAPKD